MECRQSRTACCLGKPDVSCEVSLKIEVAGGRCRQVAAIEVGVVAAIPGSKAGDAAAARALLPLPARLPDRLQQAVARGGQVPALAAVPAVRPARRRCAPHRQPPPLPSPARGAQFQFQVCRTKWRDNRQCSKRRLPRLCPMRGKLKVQKIRSAGEAGRAACGCRPQCTAATPLSLRWRSGT